MDNKFCSRCDATKSTSDFHKDTSTKDKLARICKECKRKDAKKYRETHPEKVKESKKIYYDANKDRRRERGYRENYGITTAEYEDMFARQNGRCAICESESSKTANSHLLFVDHCHVTGKVRGLLCSLCNRGLGAFEDSATIVHAAAIYLASHSLICELK